MRQTLAIGLKEFRQIGRDRRTLLILLFIPAFFLLLFGYALNFDIRHVHLAVEDNDRTPESRQLISAFTNSGYFDLVASPRSGREIERLMDLNEIRAALVIPAGMGRNLREGRPADPGADADQRRQRQHRDDRHGVLGDDHEERLGGNCRQRDGAAARARRERRAARLVQPGAAQHALPRAGPHRVHRDDHRRRLDGAVGRAEKERGTMEQVRMSPVGPLPYVVGKSLPYFGISLVSAFGVIIASMTLFGLPMRGSWLVLLLAISLFLVGALGLGLLVSTLADSQQVAFQAALLTSFLPTLMLSGFIFPIASMPAAVQVVTHVVPARYFLVALRGIVLKGSGIEVFWRDLVALVVFAAIVLTLASVRLKREWR